MIIISEILFVLFILYLCLIKDKWFCIYLIVFLFPFHAFIKHCLAFFFDAGVIFSFWKEICVLIFFCKSYRSPIIDEGLVFIERFTFLLFLYFSFFLINSKASMSDAFTKFRDMVFPLLILLSLFRSHANIIILRKILYLFTVSCLIIGVVGFFEMSTDLRMVLGIITGKFIGVGGDGTEYYSAAMMIMGINRMASILDSPNQLGLLCSVYIIFVSLALDSLELSPIKKKFFFFACIFVGLVLVASFSRTAYAVLLIGMWSYFKYLYKYLFKFVPLFVVVFFLIYLFVPQFSYIIDGTFSGEEASSADRSNSVMNGVNFILTHPFGIGLGTTSFLTDDNIMNVYKSESSFVNIAIETGLIGVVLILLHYLFVYINTIYYRSQNFLAFNIGPFIWAMIIASCVSLNPYMPINSYYFWLIVGMSFSYDLCPSEKTELSNQV